MANETIKIKVETDADDSIKTLNQLESELEQLKVEIKDVEVGSDAFKVLSKEIQRSETQVKNLNKSFEGLDTEALVGEFGKFTGGVTAGLTGIAVLGGDANESMEAMITTVAKGMAIAQGFRGAAEAVTSSTKLWTVAQRSLNVVMASNPIGLIIAAVGLLGLAIFSLTQNYKDLNDEEERNLELDKDIKKSLDKKNKIYDDFDKNDEKRTLESIKRHNEQYIKEIEIGIKKGIYTKKEGEKLILEQKKINDIFIKTQVEFYNKMKTENITFNKLIIDLKKNNNDEQIELLISNANKYSDKWKDLNLEMYNSLTDDEKQSIKNITTFKKEAFDGFLSLVTNQNDDIEYRTYLHQQRLKQMEADFGVLKSQIIREYNDKIIDVNKTLTDDEIELMSRKVENHRIQNQILLGIEKEYQDELKELMNEDEDIDVDVDIEGLPEVQRMIGIYNFSQNLFKQTTQGRLDELNQQQLDLEEALELGFITQEQYTDSLQIILDKRVAAEKQSNQETLDNTKMTTNQKIQLGATILTATGRMFRSLSELDKKSAEEKKKLLIGEAVMNIAAGMITAIASSPPPSPVGLIGAGIVAAMGAVEIAKINQQQFKYGGITSGPSHEHGGITTNVGELEGGEGVVNKTSMSNQSLRNMASAANVAGGGNDFSTGDGSINLSPDSISQIVNGINNKKVIVSESDITDTQGKVSVAENYSVL